MTGGDHQSFTAHLNDLKEAGCALLVSGDVSTYAGHAATRRLMGAPTPLRRRVLVLADDIPPGHCLPGGVSPRDEDVAILDRRDGGLDGGDAASAVAGAVDDLEPDSGYESGQLRVGVVAGGDAADRDRIADAASRINDCVTAANGMSHCRVHIDSDAVGSVAGRFDAHIELRETPHVQQRWHLDEPTGWFDL